MLGYGPVILLQLFGVIIPVVGIIVLVRKGQGSANSFLLAMNFGALIMNWSYWLLIHSTTFQEASSLMRMMYAGSVIFYVFFIFFLDSYFVREKGSKLIKASVILFVLVEIVALGAVAAGSMLAFNDMQVQFYEDNGKLFISRENERNEIYELISAGNGLSADYYDSSAYHAVNINSDIRTKTNEAKESDEQGSELAIIADKNNIAASADKRYVSMAITHGNILLIRYSLLAFILALAIIMSVYTAVKNKQKSERRKLIYITGTEAVIFASLIISLLTNWTFDITPIMASISTLFIICGTASGNFFTIADKGRGWVLDHTDNIFIIVDDEFRLLDANEYARNCLPWLNNFNNMQTMPQELVNSIINSEAEFEYDGRTYVAKAAAIEEKKETVGYSIILVDMTEHYNLVQQLEIERKKAEDANEAKSNFMSNMSHEIRTPMNAIVGMTEILLRREQDEVNTEYLSNIKHSGDALLTVINDILDFSKIESGKMEIIPEEYEIMSVLNDLGMIFLNRIGDKPIELIYDIDPMLPHKLCGDSGRTRQILLNIVNNGIKYTEEGYVKLSIRLERTDSNAAMLLCEVEDSGIGIKEEDIGKLFSTFSQVDTKKNRGKEGTGLGLSIAKQLIEAMEGSIEVKSEYGKGTTFIFSMKQSIVDDVPATQINSTKVVTVSAAMTHPESLNVLKKMCDYYEKVNYIDLSDAINNPETKLDYLFADSDLIIEDKSLSDYISKESASSLEVMEICNPMLEGGKAGAATTISKPLYTLNFCQSINHEVMSFAEEQEKLLCFTAKEARALIADDNEMNIKVALGLLEPIGMQIDIAVNGKQAMEMIKENRYDIVFMDHMMPVMDGIEATIAIRQLEDDYFKKVPIIALSANALHEAMEQFKAAGMNDFLAKPIKTKKLFAMVTKYVPEDKIVYGAETSIDNAEYTSELPVVEGLDVEAGIENSGGMKLFLSLLGDFYKLIDIKKTKIEKCLADGMIRDYTIEVHALKNTARMIGALELSDLFYELEKAGNANDLKTIESLHARTMELFTSYKPILKPFAVSDNQNRTEISNEDLVLNLEKLREAIDSFDLDTADEVMKIFENSRVPEEIQDKITDLSAYVADVAMEEVLSICDELIQRYK